MGKGTTKTSETLNAAFETLLEEGLDLLEGEGSLDGPQELPLDESDLPAILRELYQENDPQSVEAWLHSQFTEQELEEKFDVETLAGFNIYRVKSPSSER